MNKRSKKMWISVLFLLFALVWVVVSVFGPYSPVRNRFAKITAGRVGQPEYSQEVFSEKDLEGLPAPVQRYFRHSGYLGTRKMSAMRAYFKDVDFVMSESRTLKIDYQQLNLVSRPDRFALISSSLHGIPFEGLDTFENGKGSMRGWLARYIPLFDQQGEAMDKSSLVTWLAESLLVPNAALQGFVTWSAVDDTHAAASITWNGATAGGTFTFSGDGELLSFRTGDRVAVDMDGKETRADWSAFFRKYHSVNGVLRPEVMQSVWHYEKGDCVYFNQNAAPVEIVFQ